MGASVKNKGGFVVMLETAKLPPAKMLKVQPIKEKPNFYLISIIHPNTKLALYSQEHECSSIDEAFKLAKEIEQKPEIKSVETWYEEVLHIPQPKRGKMKLKTKESVESGEYYGDQPAKKRGRPKKEAVAEEAPKVVKKDKKANKMLKKPKKAQKVVKKVKKGVKSSKKTKEKKKKARKR